jgi:hypothetical protein
MKCILATRVEMGSMMMRLVPVFYMVKKYGE